MSKCINPDCDKTFYNQEYQFCSIECAIYAGYYSVTKGWLKDPTTGESYEKQETNT